MARSKRINPGLEKDMGNSIEERHQTICRVLDNESNAMAIRRRALDLIGSTFFVEKGKYDYKQQNRKRMIKCRLPANSPELRELGKTLTAMRAQFMHDLEASCNEPDRRRSYVLAMCDNGTTDPGLPPYFVRFAHRSSKDPRRFNVFRNTLRVMRNEGQFMPIDVTEHFDGLDRAEVEIALVLYDSKSSKLRRPVISGFPCTLGISKDLHPHGNRSSFSSLSSSQDGTESVLGYPSPPAKARPTPVASAAQVIPL
ncbi:hypothetical protein LTR37_020713 [Vermiconidia calcicola]|uniref:Uncharacterized protein n=1 Tax=Vermiconidia calcicola TaxID=1690605 RepID=A0ACC3MAN9_9PEZI|nr:hypothetical protein LTR37_020713 [Vermiconidia calcicola]